MTEKPEKEITRKTVAPLPVDLQTVLEHELTFYFDMSGHVNAITCSCGKQGKVEME